MSHCACVIGLGLGEVSEEKVTKTISCNLREVFNVALNDSSHERLVNY